MQGDGLWKNKKEEKYVGNWRSNKAHGYGIYSTPQSHYQGNVSSLLQVNLLILLKMAMEQKIFQTEISIKATIFKGNLMEKVSIIGRQVPPIMENL